ncbi:putative PD-(D/E)XK family protein DUF4420 [Limnobacter thiooxidans]|uniref:PD-(D/E)XK motif protein n=1 Tax=Limnobacter thiooxidans TaxID=131080 RepID=UPI00102D9FAC|nr:putative PD-(D/E)XK family protein DUF4420 [Limnobacter thiooxidans]
MARPSNEFILAWSSLVSEDESSGWQAISLPPAGPIDIQAGRRFPDNTEAVLFCFPTISLPRSEKLPEGKGFLVERTQLSVHDGLCLALTRQQEGSPDLFASMVCDVVGAMDDASDNTASETSFLRIFLGRVRAWQQFMSRGAGPLSTEAELGLAGELYFMKQFLDAGVAPMTALNGWVGPDDAPQDFLLGEGAVEVKATMSSSGFPVRIGSLEQLDDSVTSPLFLAAVRFARSEVGATLPDLIAQVTQRLETEPGGVELLRERLMLAGYFSIHEGHYSRKFEPKEKRMFLVTRDFPRLTPGTVPLGVTKAHYELNLDHVADYFRDFSVILSQLGVMNDSR